MHDFVLRFTQIPLLFVFSNKFSHSASDIFVLDRSRPSKRFYSQVSTEYTVLTATFEFPDLTDQLL
jgi:hypothetical protein